MKLEDLVHYICITIMISSILYTNQNVLFSVIEKNILENNNINNNTINNIKNNVYSDFLEKNEIPTELLSIFDFNSETIFYNVFNILSNKNFYDYLNG